MFAGSIAMQNLQEEDLNGDNGIEHRLQPRHLRVLARGGNRLAVELVGPVQFELTNDIRDTSHDGSPLRTANVAPFPIRGIVMLWLRQQSYRSNA
jgi:hypothetical protein